MGTPKPQLPYAQPHMHIDAVLTVIKQWPLIPPPLPPSPAPPQTPCEPPSGQGQANAHTGRACHCAAGGVRGAEHMCSRAVLQDPSHTHPQSSGPAGDGGDTQAPQVHRVTHSPIPWLSSRQTPMCTCCPPPPPPRGQRRSPGQFWCPAPPPSPCPLAPPHPLSPGPPHPHQPSMPLHTGPSLWGAGRVLLQGPLCAALPWRHYFVRWAAVRLMTINGSFMMGLHTTPTAIQGSLGAVP